MSKGDQDFFGNANAKNRNTIKKIIWKVDTVLKFRNPESLHEVLEFEGLFQWISKLVPVQGKATEQNLRVD